MRCENCNHFKEHKVSRDPEPKPVYKKLLWLIPIETLDSQHDRMRWQMWNKAGWCTIDPRWSQQDFKHYCGKYSEFIKDETL